MIAEELREYAYSFAEMAKLLQLKESTLKRRVYMRANIPPFQKFGDQYWFPRELFADWVKSQRIDYGCDNAS